MPLKDEEISAEEEEAVARAKAETGPGITTDEMLAVLGFTQQDLERAGNSHAGQEKLHGLGGHEGVRKKIICRDEA